jgi:hypothetical protein
MRIYTLIAPALAALVLMGCNRIPLPDLTAMLPTGALPAMRWDHRPEAAEWTGRTLAAIARHDDVLAGKIPADIESWCPGYATASRPERRAFWAGLLSAIAKYESSWNPRASGGSGRYVGVMQISPESAAHYSCAARSVEALKDGAANLECAVQFMAQNVGRDGVVAGKGNRGVGRDWMPLRKSEKRAAIADWTKQQAYCR